MQMLRHAVGAAVSRPGIIMPEIAGATKLAGSAGRGSARFVDYSSMYGLQGMGAPAVPRGMRTVNPSTRMPLPGRGASPAIVPPVQGTGQPLTMPAPRGPSRQALRGAGAQGGGGGMFGGSAVWGLAAGAMLGGMTSYWTGGNFSQGAVMGAAGGAGMGYASSRGFMTAGSRFAAKKLGQTGIGGYTGGMVQFARGMESPANRRAMVGSGAALGGFMFGGNRSHKRGFNSHRGNSFGR